MSTHRLPKEDAALAQGLGQQMRAARGRRGLTQVQVAEDVRLVRAAQGIPRNAMKALTVVARTMAGRARRGR